MNQLPQQLHVAIYYLMSSIPSERIAVGGGNDDEQERLLPFLLFIFIYDFLFSANLLPSSIPPPLNLHNRQIDDCVADDEEILIEGGQVDVGRGGGGGRRGGLVGWRGLHPQQAG